MLIDTPASIEALPSGVMYYSIPDIGSYVLDPIFDDEAIRTGRGRNVNETIQVVDCGGEECLYQLGFLFKKQSDIMALPSTEPEVRESDLQKKGKEIERKLIQRFRFHGPGH